MPKASLTGSETPTTASEMSAARRILTPPFLALGCNPFDSTRTERLGKRNGPRSGRKPQRFRSEQERQGHCPLPSSGPRAPSGYPPPHSMGNEVSCAEVEESLGCPSCAPQRMLILERPRMAAGCGTHSAVGRASPPKTAREQFQAAGTRSPGEIYHTAVWHEAMVSQQQRGAGRPASTSYARAWDASGRAPSCPSTTGSTATSYSSAWSVAQQSESHQHSGWVGSEQDGVAAQEQEPTKQDYVNALLLLRRELGKAREQARNSNERYVRHFLQQTTG